MNAYDYTFQPLFLMVRCYTRFINNSTELMTLDWEQFLS